MSNRDYPEYKISVIVPVYHAEEYLPACLHSLTHQTHSNLEILVVDDGSGRSAEQIVQDCHDERLHYLCHTENKGLFQARVTGMQAATGDYIAFVDSDDSVSLDYLRMLLKRAVQADAEVVVGGTVNVGPHGEKFKLSLHEAMFTFDRMDRDELRSCYFRQAGCCPAWHNIWNKLYRTRLVKQCLPLFQTQTQRLVMGEDILFSTILLFHADSLAVERDAVYFYYQREDSSTTSSGMTLPQFAGNFAQLTIVFDFLLAYFEKAAPEYRDALILFRYRQALAWQDRFESLQFPAEQHAAFEKLLLDFCGPIPETVSSGTIFGQFLHPWGDGLDNIKNVLLDSRYRYVSFDIFDTLLCRPFDDPKRLFLLLDEPFARLTHSSICFHKIREDGENGARLEALRTHPEWEDITLAEIYDYIRRTYRLSADVCRAMMEEECRLEIAHTSARAGVRELYDVAQIAGKEVLLISDMYLPAPVLSEMLAKSGFTDYARLFVSCEARKLKSTGHLYDYVMEQLQSTPDQHLHIGDNEISDIQIALQKHIDAFYVPRALVLFENKGLRFPTGERARMTQLSCGTMIDFRKVLNGAGFRTMEAIAANRYFSDPFTVYADGTNFDSNPYLVGYFAVGMHLAGILKWLVAQIGKHQAKRMFFTARDGWLIMQGYELYRQYHPELPPASYLYVSRRAVLPAMVETPLDFFDLPIEVSQYTPAMLLSLLDFCTKPFSAEELDSLLAASPLPVDHRFENIEQYQQFVRFFIDHLYSAEAHQDAFAVARDYFSQLEDGDLVFDMGYSGRIQAAINRLAGRRVDVLFIHADSDRHETISRSNGFSIDAFYDFPPMTPDLLREHLLSDCGPACIGYRREENQSVPVLEDTRKIYEDSFLIQTLHRGALDFLQKLYEEFQGDLDFLPFRPQEVSLPFEGFLAASTDYDRALFRRSYFEDVVYSGNACNNIENYLNEQYHVVLPASKNSPLESY